MEALLAQLGLSLQLGEVVGIISLMVGSTALSYTIYISRKQSRLDKKMLRIIEELHTRNKNEEYIQNSIKSQALKSILTHLRGAKNLVQGKLERIEQTLGSQERKVHMIFDELRVSKSEFVYRHEQLHSSADSTRYFIDAELYQEVISVANMMYSLCVTGPKEPFPQLVFLDLPHTLDNWTRYAKSTIDNIDRLEPRVQSELDRMGT